LNTPVNTKFSGDDEGYLQEFLDRVERPPLGSVWSVTPEPEERPLEGRKGGPEPVGGY